MRALHLKKSLLMAALAGASLMSQASGPENGSFDDPAPFKMPGNVKDMAPGKAGGFYKELNLAMGHLSEAFGNPPLMEVPGFVMTANHQDAPYPNWYKSVSIQDTQLFCAMLLQRHGLNEILKLEEVAYLEPLDAAGQLTDEAVQQYVGMHLLYQGYFSYGSLVLQTVEKANPDTKFDTERLQKAWNAVPVMTTEGDYATNVGYCSNISTSMARTQERGMRNARLSRGRLEMEEAQQKVRADLTKPAATKAKE